MADLLKEFQEAGKAWETEEMSKVMSAARRDRIFGFLGMGCATAACIAIAGLTPFKSVEPFVVRVDKSTGNADIISRLDENVVKVDEVLDQYWLSRYVDYREAYSNAIAFPYYQAVSIMSTKQVGVAYYAQVDPNNPKAPVNAYKKDGMVDIDVNSVSFLGNNVAQVRFTRTERFSGNPQPATHWIATITYRYLAASMSQKDRLINPLGFQVTDYRLASETVKTGG